MQITRLEAKQRIDNIPNNGIILLDRFDELTNEFKNREEVLRQKCKNIIEFANEVNYMDNVFCGVLELKGVQKNFIYYLMYPQEYSA